MGRWLALRTSIGQKIGVPPALLSLARADKGRSVDVLDDNEETNLGGDGWDDQRGGREVKARKEAESGEDKLQVATECQPQKFLFESQQHKSKNSENPSSLTFSFLPPCFTRPLTRNSRRSVSFGRNAACGKHTVSEQYKGHGNYGWLAS